MSFSHLLGRATLNRPKVQAAVASLVESLELRTLLSGSSAKIPTPTPESFVAPIYIDPPASIPGGGGQGAGDYQIGSRWTTTASGSTGSSGNPITLTWGFVADGLSIPSGNVPGHNGNPGEVTAPSILQARLTAIYGSMANAQVVFQTIFDRWAAIAGVTYVYTGLSDDGAAFPNSPGVLGTRPDVRISGHHLDGPPGNIEGTVLAYNYFPNSGDMVVDTDELVGSGFLTDTSNNSLRLRNVLAHEHGHGLGFNHVDPVNGTKLMEAFVNLGFDGPQYDDILAAQTSYGDIYERGGRNNTGATATDRGALAIGANTIVQQVSVGSNDTSDYYTFSIATGRTATFTLAPVGTTYLQGSQGGATAAFNGSAQSDLMLSIYQADGTTLIQTVNATGLGGSEVLNSLNLAAGSYVLRVQGSSATQMYQLTANTGSTSANVPSTPDLTIGSDSGDSGTDNITNVNAPLFTGTSDPSVTITLLANGVSVGTTTATAGGLWTVASSVRPDGVINFTATATNGSGTSAASGALAVTIDTIGVSATASYDREVSQDLAVIFGENVAAKLTAGEVTVTNNTAATPVAVGTFNTSAATATIGFNTLLANGRYTLSIPANAVTDTAGNPLTAPVSFNFKQLAGDANGDDTVGFADLVILAQNYNLTGRTFSQGNFNYDAGGNVDFADLVILAQQYNVTLPALVAPLATPPVSSVAAVGTGGTGKKTIARDVLG